MSIPIATSPGRGGFGPQLALSYDSGAGNGPFGFGWSLSLPSITRKTDKGLPRYQDDEDSDVFILSGAEDLVPLLDNAGKRVPDDERTLNGADHWVRRYRPRIEGLFARIERWAKKDGTDVAWRSISKDNIITWYGKDVESRIADPSDPTRIFSWLICQSYDDKGNAMVYSYLKENDDGIDTAQANERNRTRAGRSTQRYLDRIRYGNRQSTLDPDTGVRPPKLEDDWLAHTANWMFEAVFDYEQGYYTQEEPDIDKRVFANARITRSAEWPVRKDAFSSHRSGFEVRSYRICRRVLMFHHFPDELGTPDYLVRSTSFNYREDTVASFITSVEQSGFVRQGARYLKRSMPPVEFTYSQVEIDGTVRTLEAQSMENLPIGIDGAYQFVDLDGEGTSGVLTEQADAWYYKPPLGDGHLGVMTVVAKKPNMSLAGGAQLLDLAGDGQLDLANFRGPVAGYYERTNDADWETLRAFRHVPNIAWDDPNLRFVDVNGDGHADVLITEHQAITWYPSIAEEGFDPAERVTTPFDEEKGPALVFADGTQSIYLADMCGDGLTDLLRIRNGEVCYWPNLGYGRFGPKVTMDNAPWFDNPDQFDQKRVRIADIDGSGTIDILYLAADRVRVFLNQSGNSFIEAPHIEHAFPFDNLKNVSTADVLGKGTACLVWTSSLPGDARAPMKFIDLMKNGKPYLLVKTENNLGAETVVHYAPSTKFYFDDKNEGKPWITRLAFPVHVVERVETYDRISRNRFVTRYAYHHGYFDGEEREFRGFGMVEQFDTEEFAALSQSDAFPVGLNIEAASHVPPMHTKTWYHTGAFLHEERIARLFTQEYFREPGMTDAQFEAQLLPDTLMPDGLTADEAREAVRSLKGSVLRQEVYADDGTDKALLPYSVSERNYTIKRLQEQGANEHAVFFTHANETIDFHYERNPVDPRISHSFTLEVDAFGNVLKSASVGYGRRMSDTALQARERALSANDRALQLRTLCTWTENSVTNPLIDPFTLPDDHRTPLPASTDTYELAGLKLRNTKSRSTAQEVKDAFAMAALIPYEQAASYAVLQKRLIERLRSYYRSNTLAPLRLGVVESLALPLESYKLALTASLVDAVFKRGRPVRNEVLIPSASALLEGTGPDQGGYKDLDNDDNWWIASGRVRYIADDTRSAAQELSHARSHFFLPGSFKDPFGSITTVGYDAHDLAVINTRDAIGNTVTARNDYRVLQPDLVTDPNGNRSQIAFDVLGLVAGTAVMGKEGARPAEGDSLAGFVADLTDAQIAAHLNVPLGDPRGLLGSATSRLVYDFFAYRRTKNSVAPKGAFVSTIVREVHASEPGGANTPTQVSFSYSDGFGREVQKKIRAEKGKVPRRNGAGAIVMGPDGYPVMSASDADPRWVGSGWTIFNNKGKPVRQYEPFFTDRHAFEFGVKVGVSPVLFYDPADRVVCTLHPDNTWEKVVFDPWKQTTYDVNDTVLMDAKTDADVGVFFKRLSDAEYLPSWNALRTDAAQAAALALRFTDLLDRANETSAAAKAALHANTPTIAHVDSLGRAMLTIADNGAVGKYTTRVGTDIEGNQLEVIDALGRIVMRYTYDMLGTRIHQSSMEAGARWMLNDCLGKSIRSWDERGHTFRATYDKLRRPHASFVIGADETDLARELRVEQTLYGDTSACGLSDAQRGAANLRGKPVRHFDQAGMTTSEAFDFKGNPTSSARRLAFNYKTAIDYSTLAAYVDIDPAAAFNRAGFTPAVNALIDAESFESSTTHDALNRPMEITTPHAVGMRPNVIKPGRNEANLLESVLVDLQSAGTPAFFVKDIDYDAKGQRRSIRYGNDVVTRYEYDPLTFRLRSLRTTRARGRSIEDLQDLHYTYDPAGNITHIRDNAQQAIFFRNRLVEPSSEYTYDAIYRLTTALGREHLGQVSGTPVPITQNDSRRAVSASPSDGNAMGRYEQTYDYDAVGNILALVHKGLDPIAPGWSRGYTYAEPSLLEVGAVSNRLSRTNVSGAAERYRHDEHGNMTRMPHLGGTHPNANMFWDHRDQMREVDLGGGGRAWYVYDAGGQRTRKVIERQGGVIEERLYLGGVEIYRKRNAGAAVSLQRETLHVTDDKQRIAVVETRTLGNDLAPQQLVRYQFSNHLGSASLELGGNNASASETISYEEYYPYGSTGYSATRNQTDLPKRYRYTGKERDEESGLCYYGARYYPPWLGRWTAPDSRVDDGLCLYQFVRGNPLVWTDPDGHAAKTDLKKSQEAFLDKVSDKYKKEYAKAMKEVTFEEHGKMAIKRRGIQAEEGTKALIKELDPDVKFSPSASVVEAGETVDFKGDFESPKFNIHGELTYSEESITKNERKVKQQFAQLENAAEKDLAHAQVFGKKGQEWKALSEVDVKDVVKSGGWRSDIGLTKKKAKAIVEAVSENKTVQKIAKSKGLKVLAAIAPILLSGAAKAAPGVGLAFGAADVVNEAQTGGARRATLAAVGMSEIPLVSQAADIGLAVEDAGWVAKDIIDPEQKAEQWYYNTFLN
jgi:RHS repeat-associated protein